MDKIISITWWRGIFQKFGQAFGWGCAVVFAVPLAMVGINQMSGRNQNAAAAANQDTVLMTVNGDSVSMADYYMLVGGSQTGSPGEEYAAHAGSAISQLAQTAVVAQEAKREGVKANDAEIDKQIQDQKLQLLGKNGTDAEFENQVYQRTHMSMAEYREQLAKRLLGVALVDAAKKKMVVTEDEARNQSGDVRLNIVLISSVPATPAPGMPKDLKALPDAEAQKKAEALLAEAKSGKTDITAIAKANSADVSTSKKGGDTDFKPEYKSPYAGMNMPESMTESIGIFGYGPAFDEAVHKTKKGDFTDVVKVTGFQNGYIFAKVADRRNNLPKDFAPQKVVDQLKETRATKEVTKKIDELTQAAKIVFPADRAEQKAYYDYFLVQKMQGSGFGAPSSTPEKIKAQKALADSEMEAVYKKDPNNTNAAILVLESVQQKLNDRTTPAAEQTQLRERLLPLYQSIIKTSEGKDYAYRFGLADALRDKKQFKAAYENYHKIAHFLDLDTPTELQTMKDAVSIRQKLTMALNSVSSPEAPTADAEARDQTTKIAALNGQINTLEQQQKAEQKLQEEAMKKRQEELKKNPPKPVSGANPTTPGNAGQPVNLSPGSSGSVTVPATGSKPGATPPAGTPAPNSKPAASPTTSPTGASTPSSKPTTPPASGGTGR